MVKVRVRLWLWLKGTSVDSHKDTESEHLIPVTKSDVLLTHPTILTSSLCRLCGFLTSHYFLICSRQTGGVNPLEDFVTLM